MCDVRCRTSVQRDAGLKRFQIFCWWDLGRDDVDAQYLQQVKAVCEYSGNNWYQIYLLRAVHRLSSVDCILSLMNCPQWRWVFPLELLRLQVCGMCLNCFAALLSFCTNALIPSISTLMIAKLLLSFLQLSPFMQILVLVDIFFFIKRMNPTNVDQFLCCGTSYQAVRKDVVTFTLDPGARGAVTKIEVRQSCTKEIIVLYL